MHKMRIVSAILLDSSDSIPRLGQMELAEPARGEAWVRMLAAPINPADINTIEGKYPGAPRLGREGVGVIEALGPETDGPPPGTRVLLPAGVTTWTEACVCAVDELAAVPPELATEQAAVVRINPGSALLMLREFVKLNPGDWVLQNAANSAVGRAVIQIARAMGLRTANLVRRAELIEELKAEGADAVVLDDATAGDQIKEITSSARLALNAVGGESALRLANALAESGTLVTYGAMGRQPVRLPNGLLIFKDLHAVGFWFTRWIQRAANEQRLDLLRDLLRFAAKGVLRTPIEKTYPLRDFERALEHAKRSGRSGKILFRAA